MQLIARKRLYYGMRRMAEGDVFDADDKHARLLILVRAAMETPRPEPEEPAEPEPETPEEDAPPIKKTRRYQRRDMKAEE